MMTDKQFLKAKDLQEITGRKQSYCYGIIRKLNQELTDQGYMVIPGQVQTSYFMERFRLTGGDSK